VFGGRLLQFLPCPERDVDGSANVAEPPEVCFIRASPDANPLTGTKGKGHGRKTGREVLAGQSLSDFFFL